MPAGELEAPVHELVAVEDGLLAVGGEQLEPEQAWRRRGPCRGSGSPADLVPAEVHLSGPLAGRPSRCAVSCTCAVGSDADLAPALALGLGLLLALLGLSAARPSPGACRAVGGLVTELLGLSPKPIAGALGEPASRRVAARNSSRCHRARSLLGSLASRPMSRSAGPSRVVTRASGCWPPQVPCGRTPRGRGAPAPAGITASSGSPVTRGRSSRLHRSASPGSAGHEPTTSPRARSRAPAARRR